MKFISPLLCFAICFSTTSIANSQSPTPSSQAKSNHWLLNEKDPVQRTLKLEQYLRGFDQPMLEVGQRYQSLYQALLDNNYGFAEYQWKKIKTTIKNGIMKRPKRADNANSMLLNNAWADINADFISKNQSQAWQGFQKATSVCMACHIAEKVEFVNNQPLFRLKVPRQ
jgi:cytochrome c1